MSDIFRWGIIGTGNIAHQFARGLQAVPDAQLVAVASRTQEKADKFGDEFNVAHRHASYEALANDPEVDAVYIGTPHTDHHSSSILCLNAGKPVLCEKPFMVNAAQAEEVIALARQKKLFLMDAIWTRYFPVMVKVREIIREGLIGDVMMVNADFGFRMGSVMPQHRLFNPDLAGGALLDVGIYPIQLAFMVFGKEPEEIATLSSIGTTGVDEMSVVVFGYGHNQMAINSVAIRMSTAHEARIMGSKGRIHIANWWHPTSLSLISDGEQTFEYPLTGNGYNYEAVEVARCVREGLLESPVMPLDETLAIMRTMDKVREKWGLKYPIEA